MVDVIGAGLGRTGTFSLKHALERLGAGPGYHKGGVMARPQDLSVWKAANRGEPARWQDALGGFRAIVDYPGALYWKELAAAYPEARIVLTTRDPNSWYDSAAATISQFEPSLPQKLKLALKAPFSPGIRGVMAVGAFAKRVIWEEQFGGRFSDRDYALSVYEAHNAAVRAAVPQDRLLEFEVSQGWEPLCAFLGKPVPQEPFPRMNEREAFSKMKDEVFSGRTAGMAGRLGGWRGGNNAAQPRLSREAASASATLRLTATKLSGVTEIVSIPHSTRNRAISG
jgi:hypothetical protein